MFKQLHPIVALLATGLIATQAAAQSAAPKLSLPPIPNLAGKVLTVLGPVDPALLGQTLMHEHIFIDYKPLVDPTPKFNTPEEAARYELPYTLETVYDARYGKSLRTRKYIGDFDESRDEVMEFKVRGGGTIVDVTNIGLGRDPTALARLSHVTDLHIVMGSGWYATAYHPRDMDQLSVDAMTETIVKDIVLGAEGTQIRSGIIGEVGVDQRPLTANELKSTRASARASRLTGAPISFHVGGVGEDKLRILDMVAAEGVDMAQVVMGHSNSLTRDLPLAKRILERGVFIEFDALGFAAPPLGNPAAGSGHRPVLHGIVEIIKMGYADRIVLSHDICAKQQMKKYGGSGYAYISDYVLPELKKLGVSDADIHKMMVDNPRRALTFVAPRPLLVTAP